MIRILSTLLLFVTLLLSCSSDSVGSRNPNVPSYPLNFSINMNLPMYSSLLYPSNAVLIPNEGANGVIIFNAGGSYVAYEANCPAHGINSCSRLGLFGVRAKCSCDDYEFSLFTGVPTPESGSAYPLISYRVVQNGNILRVYN